MQTIEKALHQPMPFTTGGQTITDRLNAAKHSLAGSQLGKTICKATTEELMAPKKKHLDYLLHCTNEPNVSIPQMANLLIERTHNPNWTVVYKSLITIHNIMCYGNERFSQYLASCNTSFNLGNLMEKGASSGYDMSTHVRRYGKYIQEKIATYRSCAFDFCKVKRGREDGLLRTMHCDKLLKTLPVLQSQIDALLDFQVQAGELNNGVINCSFILLFRDLIRLFACYNDGVINLLEKFFDMNKKQSKEALDMYKSFLARLDKVAYFLKVAESVGIDKGEIPDLTRAPASLLEALESHVYSQDPSARPPPSSNPFAPSPSSSSALAEADKLRYLNLEKERLRQLAEKKGSNPFVAASPAVGGGGGGGPDLLDLFNAPPQHITPQQLPQSQVMGGGMDVSNPFAMYQMHPQQQQMMYAQGGVAGGVNPFTGGGGWPPPQQHHDPSTFPPPLPSNAAPAFNPFLQEEPKVEGEQKVEEQWTDGDAGEEKVVTTQPVGIESAGGGASIYHDTPFAAGDSSYAPPSAIHMAAAAPSSGSSVPPEFGDANALGGGDVDTALSSLAHNLDISSTGHQQPKGPIEWGQQGVAMTSAQSMSTPFAYPMHPPMQQQWNMQHPGMYGGYGMGGQVGMGAYGGMMGGAGMMQQQPHMMHPQQSHINTTQPAPPFN